MGIQFKFYRLKGKTGGQRGQPNYVTQIMNDLYELPQYLFEDFTSMYFVLFTEDERMAIRKDYPVQPGARFPSESNIVSIAEKTVVTPKKGKPYILRWLRNDDGLLVKAGDTFAVLPVYLAKPRGLCNVKRKKLNG